MAPDGGYTVSQYRLSLQIVGPLTSLEALIRVLGGRRHTIRRQDARFADPRWTEPAHVLGVDLGEWWERPGISDGDDRDAILADERSLIRAATETLEQLAPTLASLDRSNTWASLWFSTIRNEEQGGFTFPPELVAAAAAGGLGIEVSILVLFDPDDP
jgi:hypothetical protein